ncbi:hybrid sensor histidine kinase/response regulator [Methylobacterium nigriterrae]|uniref:hybrid sensor histidine kinase/response regulator n=1 Tax=Methylobacterium nigriterrae TaxID=3127512 RepID=UPI003013EC6F
MTLSEVERLQRRIQELEAEVAHLLAQGPEGSVGHWQKLTAGEQRYRAIFESATDFAIVVSDNRGRVTEWNTGAARILGWTADEVCGETTERFFTSADRAAGRIEAEMRTALERGRATDERWHLRKDGTCFWASGEMMPLRDVNGAHQGFVKILRDRTAEYQASEGLRNAEAQLRRAQESGGIGVFSVGIADGILHATPEFCRLYGLPERETYPSTEFERLVIPEDAALVSTAESRRNGDAPRDVEYRIRSADTGTLRWIARKGEIEHDEMGRPVRFAGMAQDITLRKQAEQRAQANERELRLVADAMPVLIAFLDTSLTCRFANRAYCDWFDVGTSEKAIGRNLREMLSTSDFEARRSGIEQALAGNEVRFDLPWPHRDGRPRIAEIRYLPRSAPGGEIEGFYVFVQDISDRKRVEELLLSRTQLLEAEVAEQTKDRDRIWRLSPVLKVVATPDGKIQSVNPSWIRVLGWSDAETVGRNIIDFLAPNDRELVILNLEQLAGGLRVSDFEASLVTKDDGLRHISWTVVPEDGRLYGFGRDVTELRLAEEALRQAQKMEAVGQLTGGLAHDFNNLLTGISGSLELLQTRMRQGRLMDVDRYINAAQGASKRAAALTHRLLAFSRRQTLDPKPTNVNALINGMEELIRRTVGPEITVEVVGAAGSWPALVDPNQLENALLNLCINARDAMPGGGRITIETANKWLDERAGRERDLPPGQYLSLCVTDSGTGMTPDVIAKAFDPFFTTKPTGQGTGLGLSMIYGFARQSGGQVRIYSEVGQGTTMCLYLPRHYGKTEDATAVPELADAPRAEQGETVLIVDDEPTVRMLVTEVLEDLGYTAIEAADAAAGLKVLQSDVRIDLLVTDVGLPGGMNGRQMADTGRVNRPDLKVLFITGYAENAAVGNGHLEPGMQVLTKPFVMEALASRIKELIGSA